MRKISNSEASTFMACPRRYYYQYDLNLVAKRQNDALTRGIAGHDVLNVYYLALKDGTHRNQASMLAIQHLDRMDLDVIIKMELLQILENYWSMMPDDDWIILGVENEHTLPISDDYDYHFRYDLLVQERRSNKIVLVDHKFVYDFWSSDKLNLSAQFPKYQAALRANDIPVDYCMLNQLRYRKIKRENWAPEILFQRTPQKPSVAKMRNALSDQIKISERITAHREMTLEQREENAVRNLDPNVCKYCSVQDLCMASYDGGNTDLLIAEYYEQNVYYGYNHPEPEMADLL